jgi:hypothetical protein
MNKAIFLILIFFLNSHFVSCQTITDYNCLKIKTIVEYPVFKNHFSYLNDNFDNIVVIDLNNDIGDCEFTTSYNQNFIFVDSIQGKEFVKNINVLYLFKEYKENCYLRIFFYQNITERIFSMIYIIDEYGNLQYAGYRRSE